MRAPALVGIVVALHIAAIGSFIFIQGCESVRDRSHTTVTAPTAPVMPPRVIPSGQSERPILQPPIVTPPGPGDVEGATHVVSKGEILSKIAVQYGISTAELAEYNNLTDPNKLRVGDKLIIPPYAKKAVIAQPAAAAPVTAAPIVASRTGETIYVVQSGDNLTRIARKYGVKISELRAANQLQGDMIKVNQKLTIPAPASGSVVTTPPASVALSPPTVNPDDVQIEEIEIIVVETETSAVSDGGMDQGNALPYIVMEGDTLEKISKLFIVSKQDLIEYNSLGEGQALEAGDIIKIPPSAL